MMKDNTFQTVFTNASAEVFRFDAGQEVTEYHAMIHVANPMLSYNKQLEAVMEGYDQLIRQLPGQPRAVFKRYFLSDAANQADEVEAADVSDCAKSIIEQAPLDGTKVALWVWMMTDVQTGATATGLYAAIHGSYRHLWNGSAHNLAANSEYQMRLLFNEYVMQLAEEECTLKDNCIRTWLFVNDIDLNYGGVVRARNQVFFTQGLTQDTHYIASTGIGGRQQDPNVLSQMDNYAVCGLLPGQVSHLYAPTHLNRTSDYGVSFERGTRVDYGDRRHVFISGTASIDNKGRIVHEKDVVSQAHRLWENIETLLKEADCTYDDVAQMIVYLRDVADYGVVSQLYAERFPHHPYVIVHAPVCRPGWLIEMECMAVKEQQSEYPPL